MRLKLLACKVLYREISFLTANSDVFVDVTYMRQGLHDTPTLLNKALQEEIDKIDNNEDLHTAHKEFCGREFDAILLGYGLCSNGIVGLSSKKYPIIVPRAHDCITLFLGSKQKYEDYFAKHSATYWYTSGWIENDATPSEEAEKAQYLAYCEQYGEENAQFLVDYAVMPHYERCTYINWPELPFPKFKEYTKDAAEFFGWNFDLMEGDSSLLRNFLTGKWNDEDFLIVPPNKKISLCYDNANVGITCE